MTIGCLLQLPGRVADSEISERRGVDTRERTGELRKFRTILGLRLRQDGKAKKSQTWKALRGSSSINGDLWQRPVRGSAGTRGDRSRGSGALRTPRHPEGFCGRRYCSSRRSRRCHVVGSAGHGLDCGPVGVRSARRHRFLSGVQHHCDGRADGGYRDRRQHVRSSELSAGRTGGSGKHRVVPSAERDSGASNNGADGLQSDRIHPGSPDHDPVILGFDGCHPGGTDGVERDRRHVSAGPIGSGVADQSGVVGRGEHSCTSREDGVELERRHRVSARHL